MVWTRTQVDAQLERLAREAPALHASRTCDGAFWSAFAGDADELVENAAVDDHAHVQKAIDRILDALGLLPTGCAPEPSAEAF